MRVVLADDPMILREDVALLVGHGGVGGGQGADPGETGGKQHARHQPWNPDRGKDCQDAGEDQGAGAEHAVGPEDATQPRQHECARHGAHTDRAQQQPQNAEHVRRGGECQRQRDDAAAEDQ